MTWAVFKNPRAQNAAKAIAVAWKNIPDTEPENVGVAVNDWCTMRVSGPALSGNYAFLSYSSPGGEMGAYAFEKTADGWKIVEKVRLGFW